MNKEQIKHIADVLKELAVGQFLYLGGKNLYFYSTKADYDLGIVVMSGILYFAVHAIIHEVLSMIEED